MSLEKDYGHLKIPMEDVVLATNNFDPSKVIGGGGFGRVFKGELSLPQGPTTFAFKQLDRRMGQGNTEFWKEIMMLSKLKHENLISLKGFAIKDNEMILVYEYASRGSLDCYLNDASRLTWIQRLNICFGAALGLNFLHDPKGTHERVLHRDIKSGNILLDDKWTAKVSDFGLSKAGPANQAQTYMISNAVGTHGYCDPLYWETGFLSKESDVYSFGVVMFEILCGRSCCEYRNRELTKIRVPDWRQRYDEKRLDTIILPGLKDQMNRNSMELFSDIAYQCIKKAREERPPMFEIVTKLKSVLEKQLFATRRMYDEYKIAKIPGTEVSTYSNPFHNDSTKDWFEKLCPPAGQDKVVIYTTSLRGVRKTFEGCIKAKMVLNNHRIPYDERDVSMDSGFKIELHNLLKGKDKEELPRVFVKGWYLGGVDECLNMVKYGSLAQLLKGLPISKPCALCGGIRFVPCFDCDGSRKKTVVSENDLNGEKIVRCPTCNENGLVRCTDCN